MVNSGLYPLEPGTDLTRFRVLAGDTNATPNDPADGYGNFQLFSDEEILAYLEENPENIYRALAEAFFAAHARAAFESKFVKDYDLEVDARDRAKQILSAAERFDRKADDLDAEAGLNGEFFVSINTYRPDSLNITPEAAPRVRLW